MISQSMLEYLESALAEGIVKAQAGNGNFWSCRRNGKTQTWKTRPGQFRIPVKIGFRSYGELTHDSIIGMPGDGSAAQFIVQRIADGQRFNLEAP